VRWPAIVEVPTGFFSLPDAENVSAVLFNNNGTISTFNRIGVLAGFGVERVKLVRKGLAYDHTPNASAPKEFQHDANKHGYSEAWVEGLDVFHNPHAIHPIEPWMLPPTTLGRRANKKPHSGLAPTRFVHLDYC
jgi:hypothetical protein